MSMTDELSFSINLSQQTLLHLDFLKEIHENPHFKKPEVLRYATWRYETKWLPLVTKSQDVELEPPLDVHWIWYSHMMSPRTYREDCKRLFRTVPGHKFRKKFEQESAGKAAKSLWDDLYEKDSEPFYLDYSNPPRIAEVLGFFKSKMKCNLYADATQQRSFYYQVALPHFRDSLFLRLSIERYKKFLALKRSNPDVVLIPVCDVGLIWRTHQLNVEAYKADTEGFIGVLLDFKDYTVAARQNGLDYSQCFKDTASMWHREYNEQFPKPGTFLRKDAPFDRMHSLMEEELDNICFKCFNYEVAYVKLKFDKASPNVSIGGKISIHDSSQKRHLAVKNKPPYIWTASLPVLHVDTYSNIDTQIEVFLHASKYICWRAGELGSCILTPLHALGDKDPSEFEGQVLEVEGDTGNDVTVQLGMRVSHVERERLTLQVSAGEFWKTATLQDWEVKWGLAGSERLSRGYGEEHECYVAEHRLLNFKGEQAFLVRIVHSRPLCMSAVHVIHRSRMIAVAHLLNKDDLPRPTQLVPTSHAPSLEPRRQERALVVRGAAGDWGVVKGHWSTERLKPELTANSGHLRATYYNLLSIRSESRDIPSQVSSTELRIGGVSASLIEESITVHAGYTDIAEHIALMFSTLVLVALCKPAGDEDALTLLRAAGQEIPTPNNRYIYGLRSVSSSEASDHFHPYASDLDVSSIQDSVRSDLADSVADVEVFWPSDSEKLQNKTVRKPTDASVTSSAADMPEEVNISTGSIEKKQGQGQSQLDVFVTQQEQTNPENGSDMPGELKNSTESIERKQGQGQGQPGDSLTQQEQTNPESDTKTPDLEASEAPGMLD